MRFANFPEEIIVQVAASVGFEQVKVMRDSGICPDIMEIIDRNWKQFRNCESCKIDVASGGLKHTPKRTRLHVFHNGSTKRVVIRSRGAANLMCLWDVVAGTLEIGQWLCKRPLNAKGCAYLPCGRFIYAFSLYGSEASTVVCTPPYFTAHALWEHYVDICRSPSRHVLTSSAAPENFLEVRRLVDFAPRPSTLEGDVLTDDNGMVVHDFSHDAFRCLAPPPGYTKGLKTAPEAKVDQYECQMLQLMKEIRLRAREDEIRNRMKRQRWACNKCRKTYAPNQGARIHAHMAKHES